MEFNSPQTVNSGSSVPMTVHSSPQIVDSSTPSVRIVAPAVVETVSSTHRSETIEHVISSPRSSVSSEELDVLEARAEAARAAQQAAEARLRYLEARSRSSRNSQSSRSSRREGRDRWNHVLDPRARDEANPMNHDFALPIDIGAGVGNFDEPVLMNVPRPRGETTAQFAEQDSSSSDAKRPGRGDAGVAPTQSPT